MNWAFIVEGMAGFIAFDKFERDCFGPDALAHYGWNATCWLNYGDGQTGDESAADARHAVTETGGHMPTVEEGVRKISAAHFASAELSAHGDARVRNDLLRSLCSYSYGLK